LRTIGNDEEKRMRPKSPKKHVSRHLIGQGLSLLVIGGVLVLVSMGLATNTNQAVQAVASGMRLPVPYVLGLGALLAVVGFLLRPATEDSSRAASEPVWFPADSTDFARSAVHVEPESPANPLHRGHRPPSPTWSLQVFEDIEWKRFEMLCAHLFEQAGFETRTESHGADGGLDIWLHSRHAEGPVSVVQCNHWIGRQVGADQLRELLAAMTANKVSRGTFVTTSTFTPEAEQFAAANGIHLLDGPALLALIAKRTPEQQQQLLQHAYEGEYWRPTCASCGLKMVERTARKRSTAFWGCAAYPRCRFTLPIRPAAPLAA
jgi:restriction system protein